MIPIIWFAAIVAIWWVLIIAARQPSSRKVAESAGESVFRKRFGPGLLLAVPPTILWAICNFVLLQAAPTAQFNAGSEYAMNLWSFWVDAWEPLFGVSMTLCFAYTVSTIFIASYRRDWLAGASLCALAASGIACFVLSFTSPSA